MPSFWRHVNRVLQDADLLIEVLDARLIEQTRNREIEKKVERSGKKLLFVINKCDLVDIDALRQEKRELQPVVYISSTDKLGTTILKKKILELSKGEAVVVGILGYPNVGKSSLINALSGRKAALTSPHSGFTHGIQKIRVGTKIMLLDTPGVFPYGEKDEVLMAKHGSIDYSKIKNPEVAALELIRDYKELFMKYYGLKNEDLDEMLEELAFKTNKLQSKGKPDIDATARMVLKDWQTGKIRMRKV